MNNREENVFLLLWYSAVVTGIVWAALAYALGGCGLQRDYDRYNVEVVPYQQSTYLDSDAGVAAEVLVSLGFEVDFITRNKVTTKWERYYFEASTRYVTELQVRVVVNVRRGKIKGQCTQRRIERGGIWYFKKCDNPIILRRINQVVEQLQRRLPATASRI